MNISVSSISKFMSCPTAYKFRYEDKIVRGETGIGATTTGTLVHYVLATIFRKIAAGQAAGEPDLDSLAILHYTEEVLKEWEKANRPSQEPSRITIEGQEFIVLEPVEEFFMKWETLMDEAQGIVLNFFDHFDYKNYEVIWFEDEPLIEFSFEKKYEGFNIRGFVDAVMKDKETGLVHVIDWKCRSSFTRFEDENLSFQLPVYQIILRDLGIHTDVSTVYQIKSTAPRIPSILKNGTTSRAKILTTWKVYESALLANQEDPKDYQEEMVQKLSENEFFRPVVMNRSEYSLEMVFERFLKAAKLMKIATETKTFLHNYGYSCRYCSYSAICHGEMLDVDVEDLKRTFYQDKEEFNAASNS